MTNWYQKIIIPRLINLGMGLNNLEKIRRMALVDALGIVLEIGIGPGYNIPFYKNISKLYALDLSKELIEIAKTRVNSFVFPVEFLNAKAENIPLANHSVDTVVSTWTLCSVSDPKKVLNEIKKSFATARKFYFC